MSRTIKNSIVLIFLLFCWNAYATTDPANSSSYQMDAPSDNLKLMVTEAWELTFPKEGLSPDYKRAYELNLNAYDHGHPEGASNIGLLYEKGLGVEKDIELASNWYLLALSGKFHSAQAEIGLARISMQKRYLDSANKYLKAATINAMDPKSLWQKESADFMREILDIQDRLERVK